MGSAVLIGRRLYLGHNLRSGEVGHTTLVPGGRPCYCGKSGCVDAYCRAGLLHGHTGGSLKDFFLRLHTGDAALRSVWDAYLDNVAVVVNNLRMMLDCDVILGGYVGGTWMQSWPGCAAARPSATPSSRTPTISRPVPIKKKRPPWARPSRGSKNICKHFERAAKPRKGTVKMYKAIIADDEETVRRGLVTHFNWGKHGVEVAGVFDDGVPALDFVRRNEVDIIVTDVRMSHMDGITLAKNVLESYPGVKIIFISGYADVGYLRDALKMEAVDYILKSIDIDELDAVITKVVAMLDQRSSQQLVLEDMARKLEQSMPLLRQRRLCDLLQNNDESEEDILQSIEFLGIPLNSQTHYAVLVLRLQPKSKWLTMGSMPEKDRITFSMALEELFARVLAEYGVNVVFKGRLSEYIAILDVEHDEYEEDLLSVAEHLQARIRSEMKLDTMIGISEPFRGLRSVRSAYANACEAISRCYLIGKDIPISIKKYEDDGSGRTLREQAEKEICDSILNGDTAAVHLALERAVAGIRALPGEDEQQNFMLFLLLLPTRLMTNMRTENMGPYASHLKLTASFLQCNGLGEQEAMLASVYEDLTLHLQKMSTPHTNTVIKRVREIIAAQYMEQLSVTSLAEAVYLTPTYLCVLFKQATGKTINEYITQERLNKAKEFLAQTNIHLYDVCYKVGYLSPSYFSRLFKKYTGQTPGEYRENTMLNARPAAEKEAEQL
ncbi:MAG: ROK family protein [Ruthenibacterium lactatiformans]